MQLHSNAKQQLSEIQTSKDFTQPILTVHFPKIRHYCNPKTELVWILDFLDCYILTGGFCFTFHISTLTSQLNPVNCCFSPDSVKLKTSYEQSVVMNHPRKNCPSAICMQFLYYSYSA